MSSEFSAARRFFPTTDAPQKILDTLLPNSIIWSIVCCILSISGGPSVLDRIFKLSENKTSPKIEVIAGVTTFMTMAYIIFVQPAVLQNVIPESEPLLRQDFFFSIMAATCISAALATFIMGLWANYPIALAPGMGENFFFLTVVFSLGLSWQQALAAIFVAGIVFLIITLLRVRNLILNAIPGCLQSGIAVGIGLFVAFIGLQQAGIVQFPGEGLPPKLGGIHQSHVILALVGLGVTAVFMIRKVKGAILWGMACTTVIALLSGLITYKGLVAAPPSIAPTFLKMSFAGWQDIPFHTIITVIVVFLYMDVFDTTGTLIGVGQQAGFIKNGKLPRAERAFLADSIGTVAGAALGTSTVTSYIESAAGVESGGRTGLANMVTGILFLVALFFKPLVQMIGGGIEVDGAFFYPITAPALIIVGSMMVKNVININWRETSESIPAFLTMIGIPLFYSISDGIAIGIIAYPVLKVFSGKTKDISWLMYALAALLILRYVFFST